MIDKDKIEQGIRLLLEGIGEDPEREGLIETPERVARMYEEIYAGIGQEPDGLLSKTFACDSREMVLEKDITFYSMCEHHLMPFYGKAHVAYLPNGRVVGLSKLARTVELYAKRPQIQERMTGQIADALMRELTPRGAMVVLEAEHLCMSMRGVRKPGSKTITYAVCGEFAEDERLQARVFSLIRE